MATVFVTVGTTSFDSLIRTVSSEDFREALIARGYYHLVLQIGRGSFVPAVHTSPEFRLEYFRYKDSISDDLRRADLVISHAGAGSCLEALRAGKPLLVAINETLMGNHQVELAMQLHRDGHLLYGTCSELIGIIREKDFTKLKKLEPAEPQLFASFLDNFLGYRDD